MRDSTRVKSLTIDVDDALALLRAVDFCDQRNEPDASRVSVKRRLQEFVRNEVLGSNARGDQPEDGFDV